MGLTILEPNDEGLWMAALERCGAYDTYHLPKYYDSAIVGAESKSRLLVVEEKGACAALPLLIRDVPNAPHGVRDATSAYGYPGAIAARLTPSLISQFQTLTKEALTAMGVVSVFIRQNPLFVTDELFSGIAECSTLGNTVAINLGQPEDDYQRSSRGTHRRAIRKTNALGIEFIEDSTWSRVDEFIELYRYTMERTGASPEYIFSPDYFSALQDIGGRLFHAQLDGAMMSSVVILGCGRVAQYHLTANSPLGLEASSGRWLLDRVRTVLRDDGFEWFHLGGGVGAREDSLFQYKAGFSPTRRSFRVVRWVVDQARYDQLSEQSPDSDFFPSYRAP